MTGSLVGYDMILSIGQDEVNSQFERLVRAGCIETEIASNGIRSGGPFGGGAPELGSYLRGWVTPPQVRFGVAERPEEVELVFTFAAHELSSSDDKIWSRVDLEAAFDSQKGATDTDALLLRHEDIAIHDETTGKPATLPKCPVYYWIRRKAVSIGTTKSIRYSIVPALYYVASEQPGLLSLEGLELRFSVLLNKIPVTADDFAEGVKSGRVPPQVLEAITNHRFNENVFSIEQLFLDFDTVDFTQWRLRDPAKAMGATISAVSVQNDGTYQVRTGVPLDGILEGDPGFSTELSNNLQYVFGTQGKNPAGRTPYILGVAVSTPKPPPDTNASLTPAWIGFSTNPNPTTQGLSTVNYEVLGGTGDVQSRVPRNPDGSTRHLSSPLLTSNDFSGTLVFARSVFFDALILGPTQAALRTGAAWSQSGSTFVSAYHERRQLDSKDHVTDTVIVGKWGYEATVTQTDDPKYSIDVQGSRVTVSIALRRNVELDAEVYVGGKLPDFKWGFDYTGTAQATLDLYVDDDEQIHFRVAAPPDIQIQSHEYKSSISGVADDILEGLTIMANKNFNPAHQQLAELAQSAVDNFRAHARDLKQLALQSGHTRFISPTGQTFLLRNPRYDDELDLRMDVTYDV